MADLTYTLQELEAICEHMRKDVYGSLPAPFDENDNSFPLLAAVAIPELVARIKELDHGYNAKPSEGSAARVTELAQTAALKRAKLEKALADAGLGDASGLDALGLEAFTDDAGDVKIRQKKRAAP